MAVFVNPHLRAKDEVLVDEVGREGAEPWMVDLIESYASSIERSARIRMGQRLSRLTRELVSNLDHAFRPIAGLNGSVERRNRKSYVQLYQTLGGGPESHNRLHIVVADSGFGIVRTLRPKLRVVDPRYSALSEAKPDHEIVRELLDGALPQFGQASGLGYRSVLEVAESFGGSVKVATGSQDFATGSQISVLAQRPADGKVESRWEARLSLEGTVVHATIPLDQ